MISKENLNHVQQHVFLLEELSMQNLSLEDAYRFVPSENKAIHELLMDFIGPESTVNSVVFRIQQLYVSYKLQLDLEMSKDQIH
jgi:hypothetical protein